MDCIVRSLALFGAAASLCGCVYFTEPQQTRIVDAATGQPIANARVAAWPMDKKKRVQTFVTDASGEVSVPSLTFFDPRPADPGLAWPLNLRIEADGYVTSVQSEVLYCDSIPMEPSSPSGDVP